MLIPKNQFVGFLFLLQAGQEPTREAFFARVGGIDVDADGATPPEDAAEAVGWAARASFRAERQNPRRQRVPKRSAMAGDGGDRP